MNIDLLRGCIAALVPCKESSYRVDRGARHLNWQRPKPSFTSTAPRVCHAGTLTLYLQLTLEITNGKPGAERVKLVTPPASGKISSHQRLPICLRAAILLAHVSRPQHQEMPVQRLPSATVACRQCPHVVLKFKRPGVMFPPRLAVAGRERGTLFTSSASKWPTELHAQFVARGSVPGPRKTSQGLEQPC